MPEVTITTASNKNMHHDADAGQQDCFFDINYIYSRLSRAVEDVRQGRVQPADTVFDDILKELDGVR